MSGADKRREPRVDTDQTIWVEGQEVRVEANAKNMSKTGMFVVAPSGAGELGSTLEIKFEDPHEGTINVKMEVVWRDEKTTTANLGLRAIESTGMAAFERVVTRYLGAEAEAKKSDEEKQEK
jgi:hypothetical protein